MVQLSIGAACTYVRKAIDELTSVEDRGFLVSPDAIDLHKIVEGSIVEAVVKTHKAAHPSFIDGETATSGTDYSMEVSKDGVATIEMKVDTLRIASVQASDSEIVITKMYDEDSPEGRMQLNKYVRGVTDDPRLVMSKVWKGDYLPTMKYYSFNEDTKDKNLDIQYIPYPVIDETIVKICPKLEYAVLNEIVAMVLESYSEMEKAAIFREKSMAQ